MDGAPAVIISALAAALLLSACASMEGFVDVADDDAPPPPDSARAYTVYLIGDAGAPLHEGQTPTLALLERRLRADSANSAVVFLGDNIYPSGLPAPGDPAREDAERRIDAQLAILEGYAGQVFFIPGNHDWGGAGLGGERDVLIRQEHYIEEALGREDAFLPDGGFPGPVVIELNDDLVFIAIDTQWWLEDVKHFGDTGQYYLEQETEFLLELDDVLRRYGDRDVIVAAHHPIFSNGPHGGYFPPGRRLNALLYVSRAYLGTPQDLSNFKYRRLREGLLSIFERHDDLVYAAGHEHALQYFAHGDQHYIVSGSGTKDSYVAQGHGASFASSAKGFAELHYYTDGSIWLTFWTPDATGTEGQHLYRARLREGDRPLVAYAPATDLLQPEVIDVDTAATDPNVGTIPETATDGLEETPYAFHAQGTVTLRAGPHYEASGAARFFLGDHYRDVWDLPVEVPAIDLSRTAGGLTPLRRGGGLQTVSLHLEGADGDQYVLRSINKDPMRALPPYLLGTFAHDVIQDQISAVHPYGAVILPPLAAAAGIYHTIPRVVYIPDDDRLGIYREEFAGMLALFESRPDENQQDEARFGRPENIIGTTKLFEEIEADNDEFVDQRSYVRARLFDMLIGDWDRHSDQWRWSAFEPYELDPTLEGEARTRGKIYRPVPRDRDFAFFRFDGLLSMVARRSGLPAFRRYTNFFKGFHDLYGLNYNGASLDRRFASALDRDDWLAIARDLQGRLTDAVIREAVRHFPPEVNAHHGERIAEELIQRRDALDEAATRYYALLAHVVDVVGSDKHERFEVIRRDDRTTEVVMYKTKKEGDVERELYRRTLRHDETDELRLYGLGGDDTFIVRGAVRDGILVRAVGGAGADAFVDSSRVAGGGEKTVFYDTEQGNTWLTADETDVVRSNDPSNNAYQMLRYENDLVGPLLLFGRDVDEGIQIGGGISLVEQGFRKQPFAARHRLGAEYGFRSEELRLFYEGRFVEAFGAWDALAGADYVRDRTYRHFYGLGNETDLADRALYRARLGHVTLAPSLARTFWPFMSLAVGPRFEYVQVERPGYDDVPPATAFSASDFTDRYYAGLETRFEIDGTDTLANTHDGARWVNRARAVLGVRNTGAFHVNLASELSYFYTFNRPSQVTLALRVGGATNIGDFAFFQANTLGGQTNLRGFRKTRFAGRSSFYQNVDLRVRLGDVNTYLTRGTWGVLGFFDNGRVWSDGERSGRWHQGYGGGLWVSPFYRLVVTATVARSREDTLFDLSAGFLF